LWQRENKSRIKKPSFSRNALIEGTLTYVSHVDWETSFALLVPEGEPILRNFTG
jgi:hypothetical protein